MNSIRRALAEIASSHPSRERMLLLRSQSYSTAINRKSKSEGTWTTTRKNSPPKGPSPVVPPQAPPPSQPLNVATIESHWPRPTEIPFQPKVANLVNLIGYVHMPVQTEASADGKYWAGTIISQDATSDSPPLWVPVIFEGDLAQSVASHLKQNDCVYITGQLVADREDPFPINASCGQANFQVMVHSVNFVDGSSKMKKPPTSFKQEEETLKHSVSVNKHVDSNLDSWKDLLDNPIQWRDCRTDKLNGSVNPKYPDFKHKGRGQALWLDTAPSWVLSQLKELEFDQIGRSNKPKPQNSGYVSIQAKPQNSGYVSIQAKPQNSGYGSIQAKPQKDDELWKDVLANPGKWWDNRVDKRNKKGPDFKHKDTGEALWLRSSPDWVKSELPAPKK